MDKDSLYNHCLFYRIQKILSYKIEELTVEHNSLIAEHDLLTAEYNNLKLLLKEHNITY